VDVVTGTATSSVGIAHDRWLVYGKAGIAWARFEQTANSSVTFAGLGTFPFFSGISSEDRVGWTVGTGVEWAIWNNWSIKAEYLHLDFGSIDQSISANGVPLTVAIGDFRTTISQSLTSAFHTRVTDDVFRIGLNYRFGGPVVAKY